MGAAVATTDANLRAGPEVHCLVVEVIPRGAELEVLSGPVPGDGGARWLNVAVTDSGSEGWVNSSLVRPLDNGPGGFTAAPTEDNGAAPTEDAEEDGAVATP